MKDVKIASISPKLLNIKEQQFAHRNHFEIVEFRYGEISWNWLWIERTRDTTMINGVRRGEFRLHPAGSRQLSQGCITVQSSVEFDRLERHIRSRHPDIPVPGTTAKAYGIVEVR
jgi:hypothetical protein